MTRLGQKRDSRQIDGAGENVSLPWNQRAAECRIEIILLCELPGHDFSGSRRRLAWKVLRSRRMLPGNDRLRRRMANRNRRHKWRTLFRLRRCSFGVKRGYKTVLCLMRVTQNIPVVKLQNVGIIVHTGYKTIRGKWLDNVLP